MSALECADSATEILASQNNQLTRHSVLSPFSGKLSADEKLKLSHEDFKKTIHNFFKDKNITPLSQLTATPPFPTPHVLAQFAYKVYEDYKVGETDTKYETRLDLPDGWKLLTTAYNYSKTNGYFGAAYWHPEHQHVVVAHRGTDPTKLGALWTDLKGVLLNDYVRQMESASTFAHKVVEVLQEVNQAKGTNFQLFFTGHSIGGWLSQIITFTTKYLMREGNIFLKSDNVSQSFHSHTVVFDSPGCKDMLSQMTDEFDVRLDGRSIDIEHLDITSYLSVPNRINTCNKHVGTVYRIFIDLSDMSWQEKHTELRNLATHSMYKIMQAFDSKTGQVCRDEQGQLRVQVVIDWPVSASLSHGKEYKSFFKWAKHFNNYHPEVIDEFHLKGFQPLRYQTKRYDERLSHLRIFSQQEQQFLQDYCQLRQLPELYKPKELFYVVENNQIQEQAEHILQSFEIENDTIHCRNASALWALIPYVKRLLQLFPRIKESTKIALSSHEVRKRVYQGETRRTVEQISRSPLHFKPDALSVREFLESEHQQVLQLKMVDGDEWSGLIKVYQVLKKTGCLAEGQYTVLTLNRFLTLNQFMDLNPLILSIGTPHLLLMACDNTQLLDEEERYTFVRIFNSIREKQSIKFIFITSEHNCTIHFLQQMGRETFRNGFVTRNEQLIWCDLTASLQEKLLQRQLTFQGAKIFLSEIISAESPVANLLPLGALLEEKELRIADPVTISNAWSEDNYIGRAFCRHTAIKQGMYSDECEQKFSDLLASSEQEYKELCQMNPESNVHWLEEKSGKLLWQQSQGSLETLREYIDTDSSHTYTADDLDKLLKQAQQQRVMLISGTAGMGKSTVLTHLSKQIKQNFPAKWVVRIDLNDHTDALKALKQEHIDKKRAIDCISEKVLNLEPGLEVELFKLCCEQKQKLRIVIMLDGFDEISPDYKETVIDLLQALRQTAVEQLWVTTRPHLRAELEDKLQQLSYTLEPFTEEDQVEFLKKLWGQKGWFPELDDEEQEQVETKLQTYAKELIKITKSVNDKEAEFTGNPLQTRLLAGAFDEEIRPYFQSVESAPSLTINLNLLGLYERFIDRKYDVYLGEKIKNTTDRVTTKKKKELLLDFVREDHQLLALEMLLNEEQVTLLQINNQLTFSAEELTRIGIVQIKFESKLQFIHLTFAEYYVADYLVNRLTEGNNTSQQVETFILTDIFQKEKFQVIRAFIYGLLLRSKPSKDILKQYGNRIAEMCQAGLTLHQAAGEGNADIIGFFLDSLQVAEHIDTITNLLIAKDKEGQTAWHLAARRCNTKVLELLWNWSTNKLTIEELEDKLLLAKDCKGKTAWHLAADGGNIEILQKIWELAKELSSRELNNEVLLGKDLKTFEAILQEVDLSNTQMLEKLEAVRKWAKERLQKSNVKLLLAKDEMEETAWHVAAKRGNIKLLQKLWDWAEEELNPEELSNKLLLATDLRGKTAWLYAAGVGNTELLEKLWQWAEGEQMPKGLTNKMLLATDKREQTTFHVAAERCETEVLQKLWKWAAEKLTPEDLKNNLLLAKTFLGKTAWHNAAELGNTEVLEKLWEWAKEVLTPDDLNNKLLLAKDDNKRNILHLVTQCGNTDILEKLWECSKEHLTPEELKYEFLLAKDKYERTAWHLAAELGKTKILEELWERATQKLEKQELKNSLLLATDSEGKTALHLAKEGGNREVFQKLGAWAVELLSTEELTPFILDEDDTNWTVSDVD